MSPLEKTITKAVEQCADRIVETLCDIVRFPSIVKSDPREAGPGERDCQLYLQKRLEALGFTTDLWEPDGPALYAKYEGRPGANKGRTFEGRPNLAGVLKGKGEGRSIMLTGHVDVVPPGASERWTSDPFAPVISEGFVRGRGTIDMKGGVACMLMAIKILKEIGVTLAGDVVFIDRGRRGNRRHGVACHGRSWLSRRRRDHDGADGQSHRAALPRNPLGPDNRRRHRRSRGTDPELLGRQRPSRRHSTLPAGARWHRHPQPPLADRPGEESPSHGSSEPDYCDADQGWRASVFDGRTRRDRHRRPISSAREGRVWPRGSREARGRGASGGGLPGGSVSSPASDPGRLVSRRGLRGGLSRPSFRRLVSERDLEGGARSSAVRIRRSQRHRSADWTRTHADGQFRPRRSGSIPSTERTRRGP